jgi:RNA polymerase sigma-70 factor (ECF subfamily)
MAETNDQSRPSSALKVADEATFDGWFRLWYEPLVRYAASMTEGDVDEAEDIVQQVFAKVWEQRSQLEVEFSIKAYLYKMVHNRALNRIRHHHTRQQYTDHRLRVMSDVYETAPDHGDSELQMQYKKILQALPAQCRQVFELSRFEELKYREIADQLGISVKTVETHISKALKTLRQELSEYLISLIIFIASVTL